MAFVEQDKEKTFTMVFDKNYEALCLYAVKFTEDFLEAEDIVQEAFVRFWEMYRDRLTTENARPLLYRMTRNMCVDRVPGETQKRCGCGSNDRSTGLLFSAGIRR